MVVSVF